MELKAKITEEIIKQILITANESLLIFVTQNKGIKPMKDFNNMGEQE